MPQAMIDFKKFPEFPSSQDKEWEERYMQNLMSTFSGEAESQQGLNFFQDNNDFPKKKKKKNRTVKSSYSNAKVKQEIY